MQRGATFWETLGGLAVVSLAALFVAAVVQLSHARNPSHISCLSNEKQLGLAFLQYSYDSDGFLPPTIHDPKNTWRVAVYPYVKSNATYKCPEDDGTPGPDGHFPSYAMNTGAILAMPSAKAKPITTAPRLETLVLLCEVQSTTGADFDIESAMPAAHILVVRHSSGSNYLLADGHARWLRLSAFMYVPLTTGKTMLAVVRWHRDLLHPISQNEIATLTDAQARAQ